MFSNNLVFCKNIGIETPRYTKCLCVYLEYLVASIYCGLSNFETVTKKFLKFISSSILIRQMYFEHLSDLVYF